MDRYPEHRFVCSQAQQLKWLEQQYPQLFDVIKGVSAVTQQKVQALTACFAESESRRGQIHANWWKLG
jgi:alpha-mannosidase